MYPFRRADKGYLKTEIGFEYNHQGRSKASDVWGGGGCRRIIRVIIIIKLFVIDWHSHIKFWEKRGVWGSSLRKFLHF